jgi:hypothetical protein
MSSDSTPANRRGNFERDESRSVKQLIMRYKSQIEDMNSKIGKDLKDTKEEVRPPDGLNLREKVEKFESQIQRTEERSPLSRKDSGIPFSRKDSSNSLLSTDQPKVLQRKDSDNSFYSPEQSKLLLRKDSNNSLISSESSKVLQRKENKLPVVDEQALFKDVSELETIMKELKETNLQLEHRNEELVDQLEKSNRIIASLQEELAILRAEKVREYSIGMVIIVCIDID